MKKLSAIAPGSAKTALTGLGVGALMLMNTVAAHAAYQPTWTPDFDNPVTSPANKVAGIILAVGLILTGIFAMIAVILFTVGKVFHQGKAQEKGLSIILWCLAGSVILVSLSGIIYWATSAFQFNAGV